MILCAIVATSENRVIGLNNQLPWHIPEDLKHFKATTLNRTVIMGRKTFESVGRPLPKRRNIVLSRSENFSAEGVEVFKELSSCLEVLKTQTEADEEVFIVGGAQIYELAMPKIKRLYLTLIHREFPGDSFFPLLDLQHNFKVISKRASQQDDLQFDFIVAEREAAE